jgi:hypothetical protein
MHYIHADSATHIMQAWINKVNASVDKLQRHVLLVDCDPLLRKGLQLLLQDFNCRTTLIREHPDWRNHAGKQLERPQLIFAPVVLENGESGEQLVLDIRKQFGSGIPAILLALDCGFNKPTGAQGNLDVISDGLNPQLLRRSISDMLNLTR